MEEGIVVDESATHVQVWLNRCSRVIPVRHWRMRCTWKIGTIVCVWMTNGEATSMEEMIPLPPHFQGKVAVNEKEITMAVQLIFPPRKLLSKVGLKLYSNAIGLISVDESWRFLFEQAADKPTEVYEATTKWCPSSREFVLMESQELMMVGDVFPTYLTLLKESPWAELIEAPRRADEIFQDVEAEMTPPPRPFYYSSSSSSDDEERKPTRGALLLKGILYERTTDNSWKVFLLDTGDSRNQWGLIRDGLLAPDSRKAFLGASILIYPNRDDPSLAGVWAVVDHEESVVPRIVSVCTPNFTMEDRVMLDVAARVHKFVTIADRNVIQLYNKRVMDIYDRHDVLDNVEMRDVVRVVIKFTHVEGDSYKGRREWVVHDYGKGEAVLPETKKQFKKRMAMERARFEYRLIEYATENDWMDNDVLWHYKIMVLEEDRREKENQRRAEDEARRKEEEEFLRHKLQPDSEDEGREELIRRKLESPLDCTLQRESACNSTHSSTLTQETLVPATPLPAFGFNLSRMFPRPSRDVQCRDSDTLQSLLPNHERRMHEPAVEGDRGEEGNQKKTETEAETEAEAEMEMERKEEEESLGHKDQLEPEEEEEGEREDDEEDSMSMLCSKFADLSMEEEEDEDAEPSRPQSPCNSTHSSTRTQVTVIPASLSRRGHNLNTTGPSRDLRTVQSTAPNGKRRSRLEHLVARLDVMLRRNPLLVSRLNQANPNFIDELIRAQSV